MVSREECVTAINKFIDSKDIKDVIVLYEYLCDIKNPPNREVGMKTFKSNPTLLSMFIPQLLAELESSLGINRIVNKNNTLIKVY